MKKTIAIIVAAIFVLAMAAVSFSAAEKAEMAKPVENTPAEATKAVPPEIEKLENPGDLKEQEKQEELKELTPEELKQLKEWEEQEKQEELKEPTPEELKDWGVAREASEIEEPRKLN